MASAVYSFHRSLVTLAMVGAGADKSVYQAVTVGILRKAKHGF
jgi:hypothetical protein